MIKSKENSKKQKETATPGNINESTPSILESTNSSDTTQELSTTETRRTGYLTPFPNIDEAESRSTILIDNATQVLHEQMHSLAKYAKANENHFGTVQQVNAICACAKGINNLIRTKVDIYKAYKSSESEKK